MTADPRLLTIDTQAALAALQEACADRGLRFSILSTQRTCAEQDAIYAQGRTAPGNIVTQARGCVSWHVLSRAIDVQPLRADGTPDSSPEAYRAIADVAKGIGWKWGGDFPGFYDGAHIEWHGTATIDALCPDPADCEAALQRSMALSFPVGGSGALGWVAAAVGLVAGMGVAAWALADG